MTKLSTSAVLLTGALAMSSVDATESNNTSTESINTASNKIEVVKSAVCDKTNLALACHKAGLEMPNEITDRPEEVTQRMRDAENRGEYEKINTQDFYIHPAPQPIKGLVRPEFEELDLIPSEQFISPALASSKEEVSNLISRVGEQGEAQTEWNNTLMNKIDTLSDETKNTLTTYLESIAGRTVNEELVSKTLREILTITIVKPTTLQDQDLRLLALSQGISTVLYSLDYSGFDSMQRASTINDEGYNIAYLGEQELELLTQLGVVFSDEDIEYYNSQLTIAVEQMGTKDKLYARVNEGAETSESVTDYVQLQETYLSYFGKEKLSAKFEKKLSALPTDIQYTLLQTFQIGSDEVGNILSDKDKQQFAGRIMKFYEEVHKDEGQSGKILGGLFKKIPSLEGTEFAKISNLIAQQADHYEMNNEDKAELVRLQEQIKRDEQHINEYDMLNNLGDKIKLANNN